MAAKNFAFFMKNGEVIIVEEDKAADLESAEDAIRRTTDERWILSLELNCGHDKEKIHEMLLLVFKKGVETGKELGRREMATSVLLNWNKK